MGPLGRLLTAIPLLACSTYGSVTSGATYFLTDWLITDEVLFELLLLLHRLLGSNPMGCRLHLLPLLVSLVARVPSYLVWCGAVRNSTALPRVRVL